MIHLWIALICWVGIFAGLLTQLLTWLFNLEDKRRFWSVMTFTDLCASFYLLALPWVDKALT